MKYIIEIAICVTICIVVFFICDSKPRYRRKTKPIIMGVSIIFAIIMGLTYYLEKPEMHLIGKKELTLTVGEAYEEKGAKVKYHNKSLDAEIEIVGNVNTNVVGDYTVYYNFRYQARQFSISRVIHVIDDISPIIKLEGDNTIVFSAIELYQEPGYSAEDNYDGDISDKIFVTTIKISENEYKKVYKVSDSSNNESFTERMVRIQDMVSPVISLNGEQTVVVYIGNEYIEQGATAMDDADGDISSNIQIEGTVDINTIGEYNLTYKVTDSNGNVSTATRTVKVTIPVASETGTPGTIYLTFDNGPSASTTPQILDILKEEGIKATFFILNYSDSEEYIIKRIVNDGHSIAILGYSNNYREIYSTEDVYMENITKLREKIKNSTGIDTTITRFPGGSGNIISKFNPGIMTKLSKKLLESGYTYFDWNILSQDSNSETTTQQIYQNVTNELKKSRSNVVLMNDFSGNTKTADALKDIIQFGKNNGYVFDKITKSTPMVIQEIAN